ncbi:MAG: glycerol-3-phosphate 1-O-acyltransferase PlsY [Ruminococcaceae bacterium]|nr:glycerol-3-phosphate 1-O-acyltransferase PlsY [Oscillospiraceae bacterium]
MFWMWGIYNLFKNGLLNIIRTATNPGEIGEAVLVGCGFMAVIVISYLLGSVNWALVISRVFYHDDVRDHGSGNAGTTNVLRTYGKRAAVFTFLGDGLKGVLAVLVACAIFGYPMIVTEINGLHHYDVRYVQLVTAAYLAATFAIIGHILPIFAKFRGGKGFATFLLSALVLNPGIWLILIAIFLILVLGAHFVSLGSIVTAAFYPILLSSFDSVYTQYGIATLFAFCMAALIAWSHRTNIKRLWNHTERKTYFFGQKSKDEGEKTKTQKDTK